MCVLGRKTQELVALAKAGDETALSQICRVYGERVRWMVRFRMGRELRSKLESMDLVQETLIHVLSGLDRFTYTNEGDFVRWLSKIAENELRGNMRKLRAERRDIRREVRFEGYRSRTGGRFVGTPDVIKTTTPSVIESRKEDLARLERAIDELRPEYREVIIWVKIDGLSYGEIGRRLGKSADAARMLATRAMAALATAFRRI